MDEPELRIGDRERRATDAHLQQAHADGVLTLTEYDERAALCWAARTQRELDELVRDLPPYRPDPDEQPTAVVAVPEKKVPSKSLGERVGGSLVGIAAIGALIFVGSHVVTATGLLWAILLFDERYSLWVWLAVALIAAGVALVARRR